MANSAKFKMQEEKIQKFCSYTVNMAAKASLVIVFALLGRKKITFARSKYPYTTLPVPIHI
jgi:hypothetical protein